MPVLVGSKSILRPLKKADAAITLAWRQDVETVRAVMGYRLPVTETAEYAWFDDRLSGRRVDRASFAIEANEVLIGLAHLFGLDHINRSAELGIVLAPNARGKGHGTDACQILCRYGFDELNLHRVWLRVSIENRSAISVYETLGFKLEGVLRDAYYANGRYNDVMLMGLLAPDFHRMSGQRTLHEDKV